MKTSRRAAIPNVRKVVRKVYRELTREDVDAFRTEVTAHLLKLEGLMLRRLDEVQQELRGARTASAPILSRLDTLATIFNERSNAIGEAINGLGELLEKDRARYLPELAAFAREMYMPLRALTTDPKKWKLSKEVEPR